MGGPGSGRRTARIERRSLKVEDKAISHALEIYNSGTPSQKMELTKQIVPKTVQRVTDPASGQRPGILIVIMPKDQIQAQQSTPRPAVIEITAQDVPDQAPGDRASNDQPEATP